MSRRFILPFLAVAIPGFVQPLSAQVPSAGQLKAEAYALIDANGDRLGRISDAIFSYAEIGFQEVNTVKLLTETLEEAGFRVERGVAQMPTAYRATYGSGSPVIGLMADYDCVPGASQWPAALTHSPIVQGAPGHGEGHNTNPPTTIGAALALKTLIDKYDLPGTVVVYGGPAEEVVASRGYMVNAGLFEGVDAAMDAHIGSSFGTSYGLNNLAIVSVQWTFTGVQGHGARPWTAKSALDAVELMNAGMNYLREHLALDMRFHYVIPGGGDQPNVVPAEATVWYYFRQTSYEDLVELLERARLVAQGATLMTGTTVSERILSGSWPFNGNKSLAELLQSNAEAVGMPDWSPEDVAFAEAFQHAMGKEDITGLPTEVSPIVRSVQRSSSSDVGDITWNVPYVRLRFPAQIEGTLGGHHWSAAIVPATPVAHKGIVVGAKALAGTVVDLFTDPQHLQTIKADFARDTEGVTWTSLIPPGTEPPTFLNTEKMARWRPLLEPYYYDPGSPQTLLEQWGIAYPPPPSTDRSENR
jgi:aminobenzoyl-glutamate utilization protein B